MYAGQKIFPTKTAPFRHRLKKGAVSQDRKLLDNDCSDSSKHHRKSCGATSTLPAGWVGSLDFHSWQANKVPQLPTSVVGTFTHAGGNKPFFHILCIHGDHMGGWTCTPLRVYLLILLGWCWKRSSGESRLSLPTSSQGATKPQCSQK